MLKLLWRVTALIILIIIGYQAWLYWRVTQLADHNPERTAVMEQRLDEMQAAQKPQRLDYRWVPLTRISPFLQRALIVSEDATFYSHEGFDWEGIKIAAQKNLAKGKVVAGGSTITQQLAKNIFLSTQRSFVRKGEEAIITVMLENAVEKRRIFEIYLNVIEWGDGIFGAEAAARHYFGKPATALTPQQAAWLAAIVPSPRYYDKHRNHRHAQRKANILLARMALRYGHHYTAPPRAVAPPAQPSLTLDLPHEEPEQPPPPEPVSEPTQAPPVVEVPVQP